MTYHQLVDLMPVIKRAAKSVAFQWPGVIEADDVEQGIHLRLMESPGSVSKIYEMEDRAQYRAIVGIGHQLASQERDDLDQFSGNFRYSVNDVKALLSKGVLTERLDGFHADQFDLERGLELIPEQYYEAICRRYGDNEPTAGNRTYASALSRGLTSLTNEMNRSFKRRYAERDDGPGTRQILTNAGAYVKSRQQYQGDYDGHFSANSNNAYGEAI